MNKRLLYTSALILAVVLLMLTGFRACETPNDIQANTKPNTVEDIATATATEGVVSRAESIKHTLPEGEPIIVETVEVDKYFDVPLDREMQDYIFGLCTDYDIDPSLVIAVIEKESRYDPDAVGDYGKSLGLMQVQPVWFRKEMEYLGLYDLMDPYQNVTMGVYYLAELMETGKSIEWVLMAYNGGPIYADENEYWGVVTDYVKDVQTIQENLEKCIYPE